MKKLKNIFFFTIILLLLLFVYFVTYTFVEPKAYDFMLRNVNTETLPFDKNKQAYGSSDIVLVVIDDATADKYRWPWKREIFCKIFNYFHDFSQAELVIHDAIFSTPDTDNPQSDKVFFDSVKKYDNLIEGFLPERTSFAKTQQEIEYDKKFEKKFALKNVENRAHLISNYNRLSQFPEAYFNSVEKVGYVMSNYGYIDGRSTKDAIIRTHEPIMVYNNAFYPTLAMRAFIEIYKPDKIILKDNAIEIPSLKLKIQRGNNKYFCIVPIKYYKPYNEYTHIKYSAVDIMDSYDAIIQGKTPKINPEVFKDKIVVIGANVPASDGLLDQQHTPVLEKHPGVDIQATMLENLLYDDFLKVIPDWINIFVTLLVMLLIYFVIRANELFKGLSYAFSIILLYLFTITVCYYFSVVMLVVTPISVFIVTMIIAYIHRYLIETKNKQKVEKALGKYMSEDVMKKVLQNIDNLGLGGKKSTVTILFSDIRGFTSMSEKMTAEEVTDILNEYFSEMEPIVRKYNGIINKFIGDAIMAIFGEPIQDENHAKNAVKCGFEMLQKVSVLQQKWKNEGKPEIQIGIGINTGDVFVGNIGSENRMEYTVIGDSVNLASRLESYNKTYGTNILISETTYENSKDILVAVEYKDVEIRGKANRMNIYEIKEVKE